MTKRNDDFQWFVSNNKKLFNKYGSKYIVIKNKKVIGVFDDYYEGVKNTELKEKLGTFIVQKCGKDDSVFTNSIASMCFK